MNRYAYRLPGAKEMVSGSSDRLLIGMCNGGFVIAPFDGDIDAIFTIPGDDIHVEAGLDAIPDVSDDEKELYTFPAESTREEEHAGMVKVITDSIKKGVLKKCVVSRVIVGNGSIELNKTFRALCNAYPDAFIFCFHTPKTGTWIGASPETLLIKEGKQLRTMSLAGTRLSGTSEEWDDKNVEEQKIVTEYICDILRQSDLTPETQTPTTCAAGPVEHIKTVITATLPSDNSAAALECAIRLSPTPALAGFPKDESLAAIRKLERHERGYYGGFCGPLDNKGDFSFFVNLRSARVKGSMYSLFVGGGIVENSEPASEWDETQRKSTTMLDHIKLKNNN